MKLFQRLQAKVGHELAVIDFGHGGCITITTLRHRLELPRYHWDIELRNTTMSHGLYEHCSGRIIHRSNFGWLVCSGCDRMWLLPLQTRTLGELIEYFNSKDVACVWQDSPKVMVDGTAVR